MTFSEYVNLATPWFAGLGSVGVTAAGFIFALSRRETDRIAKKVEEVAADSTRELRELRIQMQLAREDNDESHENIRLRVANLDSMVSRYSTVFDSVTKLDDNVHKIAIQIAEIHASCRRCTEVRK